MHQREFADEYLIRKEETIFDLSSDSTTTTTSAFKNQSTLQNTPQRPHLQVKIPPFSHVNYPSPLDHNNKSQFRNEPVSQNQSPGTTTTLLSTPHKRPIMSQSSNFAHSSALKSHHHLQQQNHHKVAILHSNSSRVESFLCSPSISVLLATKRITLRLLHHSCHASWLKVHLKLFILLSLPSFYFFTSSYHWPFVFRCLLILGFASVIIISLVLALSHFPSIRQFLSKTLCMQICSNSAPPKPNPPVVWSIGSKPKTEKRPNSGSWVQVYSNGDVYEGEFHKGKCSGSGVYYYHMSGRYEGDWIDEKYDGYGVETWAKGSRYRGQYRQGLRHGVGVYRSYTGDVYAGEWCNGQCHGCGMHTCEDGSSYVGEFKWGVKHGLGHYHFRNGDTYAGEYFADKMHGFGVYRFGNGHRYEGAWHEGRRQGLGMYTFRNGETQSGHWQNGILNVSSTQAAPPGSPFLAEHSKVLIAVQEAQQAAEKALHVPKLDERVSRAITAANKSATAARVAAVKAVQNQMHQNNHNCSVPIQLV